MAKGKLTPEDKLLKIIEDPFSSKAGPSPIFGKKKPTSLKGLNLSISSLWGEEALKKLFNLGTLNKFLIIICVISTTFLIFNFNYQRVKLNRSFLDIKSGDGGTQNNVEEKLALNVDFKKSLQEAKIRNIFSLLPLKVKEAEQTLAEKNFAKIIDNLQLVGVIWSKKNPQIMVENKEEKRTMLLSVGDKVGEVTIKTIYMDKAIVEIEGKEFELR